MLLRDKAWKYSSILIFTPSFNNYYQVPPTTVKSTGNKTGPSTEFSLREKREADKVTPSEMSDTEVQSATAWGGQGKGVDLRLRRKKPDH